MDRDGERVEVEFEEDAWCGVVRDLAGVMRHAVLRCVERGTAWGNVGCWDDVEVVLVRDEICVMLARR